jgi:hypothetical protein
MVSAVLYVPVPATTLPRPFATSTTARNRSSFSRCVSVGDSPVEPATTIDSVPWSNRCAASVCAPSRSSEPSPANGVAIAVSTAPNLPAMRSSFRAAPPHAPPSLVQQ